MEASLKLARRVTGRPGIVAFRGAFHGRTFGAASITSSSINYRLGYEPLLPSVYLTPFPNVYRYFGDDEDAATAGAMGALRTLFAHEIPATSVAAIIIEPIQGEGGFSPAPLAFLRELRALCDEHGILLIADEIQSGIARTGKMWAFEHAGIVPDVVCVAKALANGLPIGAIVSRRELQERWGVGAHGTTFGGNPVSCAAGVAVMRDDRPSRGWWPTPPPEATSCWPACGASWPQDERIGDVRGRGPDGRRRAGEGPRHSRPGHGHRRGAGSGLRRSRSAGAQLRHAPQRDPVPAADRRHGRGDRRRGVELFGAALRSLPRA